MVQFTTFHSAASHSTVRALSQCSALVRQPCTPSTGGATYAHVSVDVCDERVAYQQVVHWCCRAYDLVNTESPLPFTL